MWASLSADRSSLGLGMAILSADRATCFPRDRASCPHARRSAPASLPQDGPHRRGSPARHRARDCDSPTLVTNRLPHRARDTGLPGASSHGPPGTIRAAPVGHGDRRRRTRRAPSGDCGAGRVAVAGRDPVAHEGRRALDGRPHGPQQQVRPKQGARQGEPVGGSGHLLPARSPIHGLTRGARLLPRCRRTALTAAARPPSTAIRRNGAL